MVMVAGARGEMDWGWQEELRGREGVGTGGV